ncbi:MAG TPA: zinc ribbon domain-containing protein [Abditibacteriaceae bacterium]
MPIYEYRCASCETVFEELVSTGDEREALPCPSCSSRETRRLLSVFSGHSGSGSQPGASKGHSCGAPGCCRVASG